MRACAGLRAQPLRGSTSAAASASPTSPAKSRSTSRRSAQHWSRSAAGARGRLGAPLVARTRPLPGRRGRHLRLPRHRPQGLARPDLPDGRRRPAPQPRGVRQLRPGDPQELSGGHRQPPATASNREKCSRSSARCARRSTCSPTGSSCHAAQRRRSRRRLHGGRVRSHREPRCVSLASGGRRGAGLTASESPRPLSA